MDASEPKMLREKRRRAGVTLDELGAVLGMNPSSISRFERGYRPLANGKTSTDYRAALKSVTKRGVAA